MNTFKEALDSLSSRYDVNQRVFYYSTFFAPGGDQNLYQWIKSCHKDSFEHNERLVIMQDCGDLYDYAEQPGLFLRTLQKYVNEIDISNFFIVIVSPNPNIKKEVDQVCAMQTVDSVSFQTVVVNESVIPQSTVSKDSFCVMPWIHFYVGPDGNVLPCCVGNQDLPLGNINELSIDDIVNSDQFVTLRQHMLQGQRPFECRYCYEKEDRGLKSPRLTNNQDWLSINSNEQSAKIINFKPLYLDIRLSNTCNLKCRMCSSYFSSAIAQEEQELFSIQPKFVSNQKQRSENFEKIMRFLPDVEKLYFAGGEPLLSAEHYRILESLIELGKTDVPIVYNTNLTVLTYKKINVLDLWKRFKSVTVGASIDAETGVAEYVRHGTKWHDIENNISLIQQQCPDVKINITSTVGFLNLTSLMNLQKRWVEQDTIRIDSFLVQALISPDHLTVTVLPLHYKHQMANLISKHIDWCREFGGLNLAKQWQSVLDYMMSCDNSHHLNEFRRLTNLFDAHRQESFVHTFPEYKDLL